MSLEKTLLQNIRVSYPSRLDQYANRVVETGLLTAVLEMNNSVRSIVSPDLRSKAETSLSQSRTIEIPVLKKGNVTIKNTRSCDVQCGENESDMVTLVWKTVVADVCMVPSQYGNNEISKQADFARKIEDTVEAFRLEVEGDLETAIDTNKSQVYSSSIVGDKYALTGDAIQVQQAQQQFFFGDLQAINFADNYTGGIKVVANHSLMPIVDQYVNQGVSNDTNTAYQFPGKDFRFTNGINNGATANTTGYFMPDGVIGLLTRTDRDAQMKHVSTKGTKWFEDRLPGLPFAVGIKYDSECSDQSALVNNNLTHLTATLIEHWQISFDYAIVVPYNSDLATEASPIRKFEFV